jgi:hypothetical protein
MNDLSGHDFSRAVNAAKSVRLQPLQACFSSSQANSQIAPSSTKITPENLQKTQTLTPKSVAIKKEAHLLFSMT